MQKVLEKRGQAVSDETFLSYLDSFKPMIYCIMSYDREKTIKMLLAQGVELTVY